MTAYRSRIALALALLCASISVLAQQAFESPDAAANAFVDAVRKQDEAAMQKVLGANWREFIPRQDPDDVQAFLTAWDKSHRIQNPAPDRALIAVGDEDWTLPVPIAKAQTGWQFDVQAGAEEMKTRRIGRNELATMQAALAYYDAQKEYAQQDRDGDNVLQYAQKFMSTPGKHDGLYWDAKDDEPESPLGPLFASHKPGESYYGYRYRILTAQGKNAKGGAYDYVIKGRMTSGFALIAWPDKYGDSGVMSFMISHDGQLYEKNLGADSATAAQQIKLFDPDESWRKVTP